MNSALAEMRDALQASPDNPILRLMLTRQLVDAGELSEALGLVMNLRSADVSAPGDRALIAKLFADAGLAARAAEFGAEADPTTTAAAAVPATPPVQPVAQPAAPRSEAPAAPVMAATPGKLRVVGGNDAAPEAEAHSDALDFNAVGGLDQVKKDIRRRIILPFAQPGLVARFKKRAGGGVLLYGPPGCGKTLMARATAGECGAKFLYAPLSEILDRWSGESERKLSALFDKARASRPAVLFFDEIEGLASKRSGATASHVSQLISHFLTEFDGVDSDNEGVLVLGATNTPWAIDPAFLRAGRFDRMFFIPPPDKAARASIFALEFAGRPGADGLDFDAFATKTAGLSGADIRAIAEAATDLAIDATLETGMETPLTNAMVLDAMTGFASGVGDWLATAKDYATYANESGRYDDVLDFLKAYGRKR